MTFKILIELKLNSDPRPKYNDHSKSQVKKCASENICIITLSINGKCREYEENS
jgi:hypothetical protein